MYFITKGFIRKYSVLLYHIGDIGEAYDEDKLQINLLETLTKLITVPDGNELITLYSSQCDILLILDAWQSIFFL